MHSLSFTLESAMTIPPCGQARRSSPGSGTERSVKTWNKATILLISIILICGCKPGGEKIFVGTVPFTVELARTPQERQQGLMYRMHLSERHGMLFIQPESAPVAFWMKNTYIPLDLLYFDAAGRLLEIHANVPPCTTHPCPTYLSTAPVKYILEINGEAAARLGLKPGDRLRLPFHHQK